MGSRTPELFRVVIVIAALTASLNAGGTAHAQSESAASRKKAAQADRPKPPTPPRTLTPDEEEILNKLLLMGHGDPDSGAPPLTVQFDVEIYESDEAVRPKFEWNFGDGSPASHEQNPKHVYKKVGKYTATVQATDATGRSGKDEVTIYVEQED